ncbi:MAG: hypothetical protein JWO31_1832, partial [Phycisphaerales bacterium]|nr:hypothetical protein [Phycisphaerales bacterium]
MTPSVLFYISGHGYGHARRCGQVIRVIADVAPEVRVHVRTTALPRLFNGVLPPDRVRPCDADAGAAERSPMEVDPDGTLDRMAAALARRDAVVAAELGAIRDLGPRLMVSDVPFLAGDVAAAAGVPCVAMSNFTWDWIAEPWVADRPDRRPLLDAMAAGYARMAGILKMPMGGVSAAF